MKTIEEVLAEIDDRIKWTSHSSTPVSSAIYFEMQKLRDFILTDSPKTECDHTWTPFQPVRKQKCVRCGATK